MHTCMLYEQHAMRAFVYTCSRYSPQITIAIGDEVRDQNRSLDMMQNGFGDTDNLIGSTMRKMQVGCVGCVCVCKFSYLYMLALSLSHTHTHLEGGMKGGKE
jgi:hypothetical protein